LNKKRLDGVLTQCAGWLGLSGADAVVLDWMLPVEAGIAWLKRYINLGQMIGRLKTMLHACSLAFSERDAGKAKETSAMDLEIDDLYEQTQRELVTYMIEDPRTITKALALLRVGRSLQRIGDHIENVSDRVQYWLTGKRLPNDPPEAG
jgi:phosphate transport system protein